MIRIICIFTTFNIALINSGYGRVHDFESTRIKSTAGAGVGSVLLSEGVLLNPAPLAFFQYSTLHIQKTKGETKNPSSTSLTSEAGDSLGVIFTDAKNSVRGSIGYFSQNEDLDHRKRLALSVSRPFSESSALGVTYRFTEDSHQNRLGEKDKYHQIILGASHVVNQNFSFGAVVIDPLDQKTLDRKIIVGTQANVKDILSFMLDVGTDYKEDPSKNLNYSFALQIKFLQDLFLRAGLFEDKKLGEKGNGLGLGWASPNFLIEFASKISKPIGSTQNTTAYQNNYREMALSLTYRF